MDVVVPSFCAGGRSILPLRSRVCVRLRKLLVEEDG